MHIDLKNNSKQFKILIVFLLCFVYYGNSILNEYAFDDFIVVTQNSFTNSGIEGIPKIFANDSWVGCFGNDLKFVVGGRYRPLSIATFALENEFFGSNPYVSHFINVLLFAITAILLYLLISKVFKTISTNKSLIDFPFLATLLFIAHPIHTEVVANIKGRDEILALLGSLAAILSILKYIDSQKIYYFLLSFLCFLVAIFSKENAVTFLAIIPLTIYFYKNVSFKKHLIALAPAVIACIIFFIARKLAIGNTVSPPENFITNPFINATTVEKFATIFYTLGLYIKLLIFPHPLTLDYYPNHIKILSFINFYVILSVVVYLLLVFYAICNLRKKSIVSFGIFFFLITLSIVSNVFFPVGGTFMSERFMYIPSIGFFIIISWLICYKLSIIINSKFVLITLISIVLLAYFVKTFSRNGTWKNDFTLFTTDVKTSPESRKSNIAASIVLLDKANEITNNTELAIKYRTSALTYARKVVELFPNYVDGYYRLGNAYSENNKIDSAFFCYKKVVYLSPDLNDAVFSKVDAMLDKVDNIDFKMKMYFDFFSLVPNNFSINYKIGYLYGKFKHNLGMSVFYLKRAVSIKPSDFEANSNLGLAYRLIGNYNESENYLKLAVNINPGDVNTLQSLSYTYHLMGNVQKENEISKLINTIENQ